MAPHFSCFHQALNRLSVSSRQEDSHKEQDQTDDGCFSGRMSQYLKLCVATPERQILIWRFQSLNLFQQVQTTLSVVEEERDRIMTKLLNEEKARKSLEGRLASKIPEK